MPEGAEVRVDGDLSESRVDGDLVVANGENAAAGSGITPVLSILTTILESEPDSPPSTEPDKKPLAEEEGDGPDLDSDSFLDALADD